jgi:hypothetical protein
VNRLGRWLAGWSEPAVATVQAFAVALLTFAAAVISVVLSSGSNLQTWIVVAVALGMIVLLALGSRYLSVVRDRLIDKRAADIALVHEQLDDVVMTDQEELERPSGGIVLVPAVPMSTIERVAKAVYNLLDSRYQSATLPGEATYFEVVVMTKSLLDNEITIAAWANSDKRRPTSLSERPHKLDFFKNTVTADVYRESESKRPEPRLIPDTTVPGSYHHLYPGQAQRIKSTVVYPILSSQTTLLATLVASADRPNLFKKDDEKFWYWVLSLYERRVGLELLRLTSAVHEGRVPAPY